MLKKLRRKKTAKWIWIILSILIIPAFILWGSGSLIRSKQEATYAGRLFGKKVSFLEYKDALDAVRNQAIMQFGDNFSEMQKSINLESQAWERLILLTEAKKRKIKVNDQEVRDLIERYPFFQRKGQFNNKIYSQMLQYVFHTQPRIFEEQTRQNLMLAKLYKEVTDSLSLTDEEIKKEYQRSNEQLSLYYIASLYSEFVKDITATEEDLKDYFTKNSFEFKQPLSFNIEYVSLESEDKLNNVVSGLNKKRDFTKIAKELNLPIKETGLFSQTDPVPGIGWSPEILNLISKLKIGQFSPPIHIDKYYYLLRLKEKKEPYVPDFATIKDKIKEAFTKKRAQEIAHEKIENCLKRLKEVYKLNPKSVDFDKVAQEYRLKAGSTDLFKYGSYIEGIGASDNFWIIAQELKEDVFSEVIDMPFGLYIIKLKSRVPVDEKKFETEKTEFSQRLLSQKKQEYFGKFLEELKKRERIF